VSNPRVWKLVDGGGFFYIEGPRPNSEIMDDVHVIEKSAYTKAIEALKQIGRCSHRVERTATGPHIIHNDDCLKCKTLKELGE